MRRAANWLILLLVFAGCSRDPSAREQPRSGAAAHDHGDVRSLAYAQKTPEGPPSAAAKVGATEGGSNAPVAGGGSERKIIYNASLDLVVSNFSALETQLPELVRASQGYISEAQSAQQQGQRTAGTWVVRVPAGDFDGFLQRIANLGVVEGRRVTTEEVTDEYVDLEARIANKRKMEERVLEIIGQRSGPLAEVLQLEGELARIREEIERMQGRLRLLANQTALGTVHISAREEHNYVPPQQPTLAVQLRETWQRSWHALSGLGAAALLLLVAIAPWLLIVLPLGGIGALLWRHAARG